jgi:hypothetical protein
MGLHMNGIFGAAAVFAVNFSSAFIEPPVPVIGPPPIACVEVFHRRHEHFDSTGGTWVLGKYLDEIRLAGTFSAPMPRFR